MNMPTAMLKAAACCAVCAIAAAFAGCDDLEVEPTANFEISVSPVSATLYTNQSQEFAASGGLTYSWALENDGETWGFLNATTGDKVVYTSVKQPDDRGEQKIRLLTVTSTIGSGTASSTGQTATAQAHIIHIKK